MTNSPPTKQWPIHLLPHWPQNYDRSTSYQTDHKLQPIIFTTNLIEQSMHPPTKTITNCGTPIPQTYHILCPPPPSSTQSYHILWPTLLTRNIPQIMANPPPTKCNTHYAPPPHTHNNKPQSMPHPSPHTHKTHYGPLHLTTNLPHILPPPPPHPQRSKIYQPNLQQAVLSSTTWQNYYKQWPIHFQTRRPIHPPTPTPKLAANQRSICPSPNSPQMLAPPLPNKAPCTDLQGLPTQLTANNGPRPSPVHGKWILRHGDLCLVAGSLKMSSTGAASSSGTSGQVMATHWRSLILMCPSWCQICTMPKQALSDLVSLYSTLLSYLIICGRWAL